MNDNSNVNQPDQQPIQQEQQPMQQPVQQPIQQTFQQPMQQPVQQPVQQNFQPNMQQPAMQMNMPMQGQNFQAMPMRPVEPFNLFHMIGVLFSQGPSAFFYQKPSFSTRLTIYLSTAFCALIYIIATSFTKVSFAEKAASGLFGALNKFMDSSQDVFPTATRTFSFLSFARNFFVLALFIGLAILFISLAQKRGLCTPRVDFSIVNCILSASMILMAPLYLLGTLFSFIPLFRYSIFAHSAILSFLTLVVFGIGSVLNNEEGYAFKISMILFPVYMLLYIF